MVKCKICGNKIEAMQFAKILRSYGYCVEHCPKDIWGKVTSGRKKRTRRHRIQCSGKKANGNRCRIKSGKADPTGEWYCKHHSGQKGNNIGITVNQEITKNKIPYEAYLISPEWKARRTMVISYWDGKCALCNAPANTVHHNNYRRKGKELHSDLVLLCEFHHSWFEKHHKYDKKSNTIKWEN